MSQAQEQVSRRGQARAAAARRRRRDAEDGESAYWQPDWYRGRRSARNPRVRRARPEN